MCEITLNWATKRYLSEMPSCIFLACIWHDYFFCGQIATESEDLLKMLDWGGWIKLKTQMLAFIHTVVNITML